MKVTPNDDERDKKQPQSPSAERFPETKVEGFDMSRKTSSQ